jgi:predicted Zn-dependent peptidase
VSADALETAVVAEIDRIRRDGVSEPERARALALLETGWISALQSAGARADKLSQFATYHGDPSRVNDEPARHAAVTTDDLARFAASHLGPENRAFLMYVPRVSAVEAA